MNVRWPTVLTPAYVVLPKKPHSGQNLFVRKPSAICGPLGHNVREATFLFCQGAPDILKPLDRFPHFHRHALLDDSMPSGSAPIKDSQSTNFAA
jgi:hypothetical protein